MLSVSFLPFNERPLFVCFFNQVYKKKTEVAKKEYLKQLAAYRASQVSQVGGFPISVFYKKSQQVRIVSTFLHVWG